MPGSEERPRIRAVKSVKGYLRDFQLVGAVGGEVCSFMRFKQGIYTQIGLSTTQQKRREEERRARDICYRRIKEEVNIPGECSQ